eukprot:124307-Rhodomonas_salina.3
MALGIRGDSLAGDQGMQLGNGEWGAAVGWGPGSASTLPVVLGEDDWAASRGAATLLSAHLLCHVHFRHTSSVSARFNGDAKASADTCVLCHVQG